MHYKFIINIQKKKKAFLKIEPWTNNNIEEYKMDNFYSNIMII